MKKAMVFGAGRSGLGAKKVLEELNYEVILVDDKTAMSTTEAKKYLDKIELFIKSPGIPYNEFMQEVIEKNIEIIDEIELGYRYMQAIESKTKIIAITGTNGKTTTTTKITELLNFSGKKAKFAGNIGVSFCGVILENNDLDYIVLETSSFQLENIKQFKPFISLVINLTPDHLERYRDFEEYYDTKFNICKNQKEDSYFIMNMASERILQRRDKVNGKIIKVSQESIEDLDYWVEDKKLMDKNGEILEVEKLSLKGKHNLENVLFIVAVAKICGIKNEVIREFLYNTNSLEHRMEFVLDYGNIRFINDSKATNIESSKYAIEAYKNCILICGGYDKGLDWAPLIKLIIENAKEVYLIGVIAPILKEKLIKDNYDISKIHTLDTVENSLLDIKERFDKNNKEVVLFSPSTSSYDQFKSFEHRGEVFKELVRKNFGKVI